MKDFPENAILLNTDLYEIYALVDPRNKRVKYVGISYSAQARYHGHIQNSKDCEYSTNRILSAWIEELRLVEMKPQLYLLEKIASEKRHQRENYWINYFGIGTLFNELRRNYSDGSRPEKIMPIR